MATIIKWWGNVFSKSPVPDVLPKTPSVHVPVHVDDVNKDDLLNIFKKVFFTYFKVDYNQIVTKHNNHAQMKTVWIPFKKEFSKFIDVQIGNKNIAFKPNMDSLNADGRTLAVFVKDLYINKTHKLENNVLDDKNRIDLKELYDSLNDYYKLGLSPIDYENNVPVHVAAVGGRKRTRSIGTYRRSKVRRTRRRRSIQQTRRRRHC